MKWEYKTIKLEGKGVLIGGNVDQAQLDQQLNELGAQGWEACTAFSTAMFAGPTRYMVVIFKRPKS
jgi:hypothetical protein